MDKLSGFFAYPSSPNQVVQTIREAIELINRAGGNRIAGWEENDIAGRPLTAPIFENINGSNILVADITKLNFNVTYEIGYGIGVGRRVFLVRNKEFEADQEQSRNIGIFDTLGYETYATPQQLARCIIEIHDPTPLNTAAAPNRTAPIYLLETPVRGGILTHIVARIKKARLLYRSFAPAEESRLSAMDAINHVASSFGVVVPLLSPGMSGHDVHNIRAAFITGLSHGMSRHTLILQDQHGPIPLDVRDFAKTYSHPEDIDTHIHEFSLDVYETTLQSADVALPAGNFLSSIFVGDALAENEFQTLGAYYLQTDEFGRALRGEVNLVVGRKGTGKTALFSQVRNKKRQRRDNVVVDLKPEGYQLIKLKEEVLDYLTAGAKAHLITAFWEYLLYLEIGRKLLEKDATRHLRESNLYQTYRELAETFGGAAALHEGDFSERLLFLSQRLAQDYAAKFGAKTEVRLTTDEVTAFLHSNNIRKLQEKISNYLRHKDEVWVLFDNLDKGWSTQGLVQGDVVILRCLIDAARKIERQMNRGHQDFHAIVFIRNDVYQLLMEKTADFGKESRASLDWSDPDMLREMLRRRLVQSGDVSHDTPFEQIWNRICVSHYKGEETSQYLINRCLMRPRNFIKLFNACRGFAVNHQHDRIEADDIEQGARTYSNDVLIDADNELTDVEPSASGLLYQFLGEDSEFSVEELRIVLDMGNVPPGKHELVIEFLLYYGFIGIRYVDHEPQYIYDVGYDMQIFKTRIAKSREAIKYVLNPAFWPALSITGH